MRFADITGLEEVKQQLTNAVQANHLAHAQLFVGPEGSANLALALAFATFLQCTNRQLDFSGSQDACGLCPACQKMAKFQHPDVHYVFPVSATSTVKGEGNVVSKSFIGEWRKFLADGPYGSLSEWRQRYGGEDKQVNISKEESRNIISSLALKSYEGPYKIMLIWLPEYMHPAGANGILKILEEPPAKTVFILVTHDTERLLATILSRTQIVKIRAFSDAEIEQILTRQHSLPAETPTSKSSPSGMKNSLEVPPGVPDDRSKSNTFSAEKAQAIARLAGGNLQEALRLSAEATDESFALFRDWMRLCYEHNYSRLVGFAEDMGRLGRDAQRNLLLTGLNLLRETLVYPYAGGDLVRLQSEELDFAGRFSKIATPLRIQQMSELVNQTLYYLERNANPKIALLALSLKLAGILRS